MLAYQTDENNYYVNTITLDESPLEPGVFLIPRGAYTTAPTIPQGMRARWDDGEWVYEELDITDPDVPDEELTPEQLLERERNEMIVTPAQMRLALLGAGLLSVVQEIADSDPQASIVWEYAVQIIRNSPFIEQLADNQIQAFTATQIDDIFRAAMAVNI